MDARFPRIERLPPYVFNVIGEMRQGARAAGEDVIDFSMGNPDQPTPEHIVKKLVETANREDTHRYSQSKGIPRLRRAMAVWYRTRFQVESRKPGADCARGDHDHFMTGRVEICDSLGQASEHSMMNFSPGLSGENASANLDDDTLACRIFRHVRAARDRIQRTGRDDMATVRECKASVSP